MLSKLDVVTSILFFFSFCVLILTCKMILLSGDKKRYHGLENYFKKRKKSMELYKALFIDDRDTDNFLNDLMVKEDGIPLSPSFVKSGDEALTFLENIADEEFPQIIFVDVWMPKMNGMEFVELYNDTFQKSHPDTAIYFLTSAVSETEKEQALAIPNVKGLFSKPIRSKIFDEVLKDL